MKRDYKSLSYDEVKPGDEDIDVEGDIENVADKLAKLVSKKLGIKPKSSLATKIYSEIDLKSPYGLTGDDRILGFMKAILMNDVIALKALSEGSAAGGGYLVPDELRTAIIQDISEPTHMRSLVRVVPMTRDIMRIPKLGSTVKMRWTSENAAKSTTTADFDEKVLTAFKLANIIYASDELIEDAVDFNLVDIIVRLFSQAVAEEEDKVITSGTGTGQPLGLTNCSINSVSSANGILSFDDIINLIYALPSKYRANAKFLCNNRNIRDLRKLKDGQNNYIWTSALSQDQSDNIFGYPVFENNNLGNSEIFFGDYAAGYWLGDKGRISVTISREAGSAWEHDQVGIRVVHRIAGTCVLENAIRKLVSIN